ncbi:MAG: dynamin family protein [Candidatus Marinarcus sp.]|uniref:dynamin family protein n=1 Tax=Candidatus Marinarcus sp. TaxID=3100987 RepID=UPI003B00D94A
MNLANDYFLLYHGIQIDKTTSFNTTKRKMHKDFFDIAALALCPTRKDAQNFITLNSFKVLIEQISDKAPHNLNDLNQLQHGLLDAISKDTQKEDIEKLNKAFTYLKDQEIINEANYTKLMSLFDPTEVEYAQEQESFGSTITHNTKSFQEHKDEIEQLIRELHSCFNSNEYKTELDETSEYINNQKFSIGITGVMNAGKSTMLNALMGKEILGSAVVPETANLTIVKYDNQPSAKVFFWNTQEWNKIIRSGQELESIAQFVKETQSIFGDELNAYIQDESKSDDVDINQLALYTSAEASGKKCNLVKYVELKSNLDFLANGIEIVDTPGLDDPVIQREEITKEYLAQCDLMLHLMNVSQSATLKDVEFIIDALLYQNISKLLIVITRADTVSQQELQEVIDYTKASIEQQLKAQNKDSKLDYILNTIKFIPISGKMALLHRTGREQEALDAGFKIEDTGILEIENYLNETLFGTHSSKSELIIKSAKAKLFKSITKELKSLNYEIILLSKSKEELEADLEEFNNTKNTNEKIFQAMREDIHVYKNEAKNYIETLETFIINELLDLQTLIKQRVFNDVRYSYEKTKKKPASSRIKTIIETAIKDGIIDIIRDYRYKFIKKSQDIGEICEQKYHDFGFTLGHKNDNFDARGFFQDDFKTGFLTTSNEVLITKIVNEVSNSKANKLSELDRNIEKYIKDEFEPIESNIKEKTNSLAISLTENFFKELQEPLVVFEQKLQKDEKSLQNRIKTFEENEKNKESMTLELHKKIKRLELINKGLKS